MAIVPNQVDHIGKRIGAAVDGIVETFGRGTLAAAEPLINGAAVGRAIAEAEASRLATARKEAARMERIYASVLAIRRGW